MEHRNISSNEESERISALPQGWAWTSIGDFVDVILGQSPPSSTYNEEGIGLPFFQGKLEFGSLHPTVRKWCSEPNKIANKGDILLSVRAPVGATNIATERCCIGRGLAALHPVADVNSLFVLYLLRAFERKITEQSTGSTFDAIAGDRLKRILLPIPPLREQHRIVTKIEELLTQMDAGVAALESVQAQLRRYRQAVLADACDGRLTEDWRLHGNSSPNIPTEIDHKPEKRRENPKQRGRLWGAGEISELSDAEKSRIPTTWTWKKVQDLGNSPEDTVQIGPMSMQSKQFTEQGVPVLNVGCVQQGLFDKSKLDHLSEGLAQKFSRYRIKTDDIIFTRSGTVGRCAIATDKQNDYLMTFHLLRVRIDQQHCLPQYLLYVFQGARHIRAQIRAGAIGTTRAGFNTRLLANLDVPLPPLNEQREIVKEVERLFSIADEVENTIKTSLKQAESLRRSILKKAFEGELVPQDPNDEPASVQLERIKAEKATQKPDKKRGKKVQTTSQRRLILNGE